MRPTREPTTKNNKDGEPLEIEKAAKGNIIGLLSIGEVV
jgi:hypothetical protein